MTPAAGWRWVGRTRDLLDVPGTGRSDQIMMDVALHVFRRSPWCWTRAGITGGDGASHNGMWDCHAVSYRHPR